MSARPLPSAPLSSERGIALLTTILMMVLMSALLVGFTTAVMSDQSYRVIDRDRARAFYGAQSGIEKLNADLARLFINQVGPTDAAVTALGAAANQPVIPNVTYVTVGTSPDYAVTPLGPATNGIISSGAYDGLMALKRQFQLDSTARAADGGEVHLKRIVEAVAIPVFQFGIFSSVDLAFNAADGFNFGGRVHTNGDLYLAEGSGNTLTISDKVTAVRQVVRQFLSNGVAIASAGQTGTVSITRGNTTGPFRSMAVTEGSVVGGPTSAANAAWPTVSLSTYVGNIRTGLTGVKPLNLDLVAANGANIDLIKRPPPTEAVSSGIFAERYFKKVSVRVLLSDTAADITALPTVSATAPIALDGDWVAATPAGYGPIAGNRPPIARSGGLYPDVPANSRNATTTGTSAGTNRPLAMSVMPDYFKLPANMSITTILGVPLVTGVNCTGKTQNTLTACTKTSPGGSVVIPAGSLLVGTSRTVDGGTVSMPVAGFTFTTSSLTITAQAATATYPTLKLSVNTFFIRDKNILVSCIGYTTTGFTGCNVDSPVAANDKIETAYLSPAGTGTIGGFLKVEIQTAPDVWRDVTLEFLNYGISGPNLSGLACGDPTPNAIIRLQRLRDNDEPTPTPNVGCSYKDSTASADHWPNVLFDVREALSRDAAPAGHNGRVMLGGTMQYVALDARNLSQWFAHTGVYAAGTGNLAMREGGSATAGFSLYFSDRRSNRNAASQETGEYGNEDIVNPASATGAPNGVLDAGEDVNANGILDTYGSEPSWGGAFNTAGPSTTPMDGSATPLTFVSGGQAKVNRQIFYRHALEVYNGSLGNLIAPGLTIAAENAVYLLGDWNASAGAGWTGASVATSIAADTVVALSANWNDLNSFGPPGNLNPYDITARPRNNNTFYRLALISGKGMIFPAGAVGGTYGTDGGAHNFIRFIEGDGGGADLVNYMGSMVTFYYARQNLMPHKCCGGIIYGVPTRNYSFDINFLDPAKLPPLTPAFRDINALGFSQETRPGK